MIKWIKKKEKKQVHLQPLPILFLLIIKKEGKRKHWLYRQVGYSWGWTAAELNHTVPLCSRPGPKTLMQHSCANHRAETGCHLCFLGQAQLCQKPGPCEAALRVTPRWSGAQLSPAIAQWPCLPQDRPRVCMSFRTGDTVPWPPAYLQPQP